MKINKCRAAIAAIGVGLALANAPAGAAVTFFSPVTAFQDDNIDFIVDTNGNGIVDQGDRLISVLEFNNTQGILLGQGPANIAPTELAGVSDVTVLGVDPVTGRFIFGPSGANGILSAFAAGTTVALWHDTTPDLDVINANCGTRAQCIVLAGLGGADPASSLFVTAGFFGDADASWTSNPLGATNSIAAVQTGGASTTFTAFSFALQIGVNNTGVQFGDQSCGLFCGPGGNGLIQVTGSGNVLGGQGLDPAQWTARSDNDAQLVPISIPEPGSLALLGLGLLGLLGFGTRKRNT